jgi:hypothetical protein
MTMHHPALQAAVEADLTALPTPTTPRHNIRICPTNRALFAALFNAGQCAPGPSRRAPCTGLRVRALENAACVSRMISHSVMSVMSCF